MDDLDVYIVHSEMELALLLTIHIDNLAHDFYYIEDRELNYEKVWPYLFSLLINDVTIENGELKLPEFKPKEPVYKYSFTYDFMIFHEVENTIDKWTFPYKTSFYSNRDRAEFSLADMLKNVEYDDAALEDESRTDAAFSAYGVFGEGQAVCNGYSQAYMGLLKDLDIPSILVASQVDDHAWNMVYVENEWLYVDATWEDDFSGDTRYWTYFLINQTELEEDHQFDSGSKDTLNAKDYLDFAHYIFPQTKEAQWNLVP
jgi:transglutaminase/protease-like cytokinesis protein 3